MKSYFDLDSAEKELLREATKDRSFGQNTQSEWGNLQQLSTCDA